MKPFPRPLPLLATFLFALLWSGCATTRVDPAALARIKTVAVVSSLEEKLTCKLVGTTAFNNARYDLPDAPANRNTKTEQMAGRLLIPAGLSIVRLDTSAPVFRTTKSSLDFWTAKDNTDIQPLLKAVGAQGTPDAVLLLNTFDVQDPFMGTNQIFSGYGLYHRSFFSMKQSQVFVVLVGALYDARDGKPLARRGASAAAPLSNVSWRKEGEPFTEAEQTEIQSALDEAFNRALADLLNGIGLVAP
jgi:hypothetical protein